MCAKQFNVMFDNQNLTFDFSKGRTHPLKFIIIFNLLYSMNILARRNYE